MDGAGIRRLQRGDLLQGAPPIRSVRTGTGGNLPALRLSGGSAGLSRDARRVRLQRRFVHGDDDPAVPALAVRRIRALRHGGGDHAADRRLDGRGRGDERARLRRPTPSGHDASPGLGARRPREPDLPLQSGGRPRRPALGGALPVQLLAPADRVPPAVRRSRRVGRPAHPVRARREPVDTVAFLHPRRHQGLGSLAVDDGVGVHGPRHRNPRSGHPGRHRRQRRPDADQGPGHRRAVGDRARSRRNTPERRPRLGRLVRFGRLRGSDAPRRLARRAHRRLGAFAQQARPPHSLDRQSRAGTVLRASGRPDRLALRESELSRQAESQGRRRPVGHGSHGIRRSGRGDPAAVPPPHRPDPETGSPEGRASREGETAPSRA